MEKRRSPRISIMAELTYQVEGIAITKRVSDVSEGGLFVDTPIPSDVGTRVKIKFSLDGEPIEAEGRVVYSQPYIGMGIEFVRMTSGHREVVRRFVQKMAPQPVGV